MAATVDVAALRARLAEHGQEHVLRFWDELTADQRASLAAQVDGIDLAQLGMFFARTRCTSAMRGRLDGRMGRKEESKAAAHAHCAVDVLSLMSWLVFVFIFTFDQQRRRTCRASTARWRRFRASW